MSLAGCPLSLNLFVESRKRIEKIAFFGQLKVKENMDSRLYAVEIGYVREFCRATMCHVVSQRVRA